MRYILNDSGYIEAISFGCSIECKDKTCTEYTGTIPEGYETLAIWSETANINAYKIVDGNLTYDSNEDARLQTLWANQSNASSGETNTNNYSTEEQIIGTWIDKKPIYRQIYNFSTTDKIKNNYVSIDINQMESIVSVKAVAQGNNANYFTLLSDNQAVMFNKTKTICNIYFNNTDAITYTGYIILEYTKTSD